MCAALYTWRVARSPASSASPAITARRIPSCSRQFSRVRARLWRATAETWSFAEVNELIERHNRNFPAEARLPMDPRTRDFVKINGRPYQRQLLDADWILGRWRAELEALRVDVDDGVEPGAAHRRGGRTE